MNEWIKIEDKLPEEFIDVLVSDGENVAVAYQGVFSNEKPKNTNILQWHVPNFIDAEWTGVCWLSDDIKKITHWMPLPEIPNK